MFSPSNTRITRVGSHENFIGGDAHDVSMPLDYFVWAVVGESRTFIVDTGFDAAMAEHRSRTITNPVEDGLKKIGISADTVEDVILTHMHYDHAGNRSLFPRARYHIQDREMAYCTGRCMCHSALKHPFEVDDVKAMVDRGLQGSRAVPRGCLDDYSGFKRALGGGPYERPADRAGPYRARLGRARLRRFPLLRQYATEAAHSRSSITSATCWRVMPRRIGLRNPGDYVIPGHDPQVLERFPAHAKDTKGWIARLDVGPQ